VAFVVLISIQAAVPVGEATLYHTHDLDNVPIVIAGGMVRTRVAAGATSDTTLEIGRAWFAKAAYTHQIANIGTTPLRFIDAEIRSGWNRPSPDEADPAIPQESTIIENAIVRLARIQLPHRATFEGIPTCDRFCMWKCPADRWMAFRARRAVSRGSIPATVIPSGPPAMGRTKP
jgi:hypothetical protein